MDSAVLRFVWVGFLSRVLFSLFSFRRTRFDVLCIFDIYH
jgi:hypothetical protein